jgi:hypothetical protein
VAVTSINTNSTAVAEMVPLTVITFGGVGGAHVLDGPSLIGGK